MKLKSPQVSDLRAFVFGLGITSVGGEPFEHVKIT